MGQLVCAEFDEFEEALYGVQGRYLLRSRQLRDWRLRVVELGGVALMLGREGAGTLYSGVGLPQFFNIFLPVSGQDATVVDGHPFDRRLIAWMVPEAMFHIDARRPASWLTVAMSYECVMRWLGLHEDEFDASILMRNQVSLAHRDTSLLVSLAMRLFHIDEQAPDELHTPEGERAARGEILDTVFRTLLPVDVPGNRERHSLAHRRILEQALGLLGSLESTPVYLDDLCAVSGASERTVRSVFNHYLGMSPHRYLMLWRLHAIRMALHRARPDETVTSICARFGVWDFGRLARYYREVFGELPSQSLHRWRN